MIYYDNFKNALKNLELQHDNYTRMGEGFPQLIEEAVAESVIQRFEICYDSLGKVLKRYLQEELGVPDVPNSPRGIFRIAHENDLLPSDFGQWVRYMRARIDTTHTYSAEKAAQSLLLAREFIGDATALYTKMSSQAWE